MSLSTVVKNIYTFANILSQAGTDVVSRWDDRSLQNAFNWAKYCMKIEEQTRGKPYRADLDLHVQSLTLLLQPVSLLELTVDKLQYALSILCTRILNNPDAPGYIVNAVATGQSHGEKNENVVGIRKIAVRANKLYQLFDEEVLLKCPTTSSLGRHVVDRLVHLQGLLTSSENRFNRFVEKLTLEISRHESGWEVLAHMLLSEVNVRESHDVTEQLKQQILGTITSTDQVVSCMWACDCRLLCELSSRDDRFLQFHIDQLVAWIEEMEPVYGPTDNGELYTWRYGGRSGPKQLLSFRLLIRHVLNSLNYSKRLKNILKMKFVAKAGQSYFSVWKDLSKAINEINI